MGRTSGSGNINWLVSGMTYRFKPGRPGCRKCMAQKRNGQPCNNLAMRSISVCQCHGGRMLIARLRRRERRTVTVLRRTIAGLEGSVPLKLWLSALVAPSVRIERSSIRPASFRRRDRQLIDEWVVEMGLSPLRDRSRNTLGTSTRIGPQRLPASRWHVLLAALTVTLLGSNPQTVHDPKYRLR